MHKAPCCQAIVIQFNSTRLGNFHYYGIAIALFRVPADFMRKINIVNLLDSDLLSFLLRFCAHYAMFFVVLPSP